jgi:hypothetical protein
MPLATLMKLNQRLTDLNNYTQQSTGGTSANRIKSEVPNGLIGQ